MSTLTAPVRLTVRRFGETGRRDSWWIQPLVVFAGLSTFLVYATWAAFQGNHYTYGPYLSPFYSPELFGSSPHSWFGPKPAAWPDWYRFRRHSSSCRSRHSSGSPATTTAARTTKRSGRIHHRARSVNLDRRTGARIRFRWSSRTSIVTCSSCRRRFC